VVETYSLPWLPNWGLLRRLVAPFVHRQVDKVWEEDLRVGVCIGGWPGVPKEPSRVEAEEWRQPLRAGSYRIGPAAKYPAGSLTRVDTTGGPVLIAHTAAGLRALHPLCPHTGGPLQLGALDGACVVCPWHGARFDACNGHAVAGPTRVPLPVYVVRIEAGEVIVEA
jgi:nitrite reductase/ring-hydroxylating ferredoxin subunit